MMRGHCYAGLELGARRIADLVGLAVRRSDVEEELRRIRQDMDTMQYGGKYELT